MRARTLSLLLMALLLAPALGGCIGTDDDLETGSTDVPTTGELIDAVAALENGEPSANVELISKWREGGGQEADVWGDFLFVDRGAEVIIFNVSDPRAIREVTTWTHPRVDERIGSAVAGGGIEDVKVSDDGNWMFIADDQEASRDLTSELRTRTGGFYTVDISDMENPELTHYLPVGDQRGPHMAFYAQIGGGEYVFGAAGPDVVVTEFDRASGSLTEIARYTPGQLAQDRDPNRVDAYYNARAWLHDMFVMVEEDGTALMYVAAWDAGLRVVDVSTPSAPEELGAWSDFADDEAGNLHTVVTNWVGDRRITVGSVEVGFLLVGGTLWAQKQEPSTLYVWDTTDPEGPELLGTWVNPIDPYSGRRAYVAGTLPGETITSTHNVQLEEGRVYLAHYDLGVFVLDVSTPETQAQPELVGYYNESLPSVWDVVLHHGALYTSGQSGVAALHFALDTLGPEGVTSRA